MSEEQIELLVKKIHSVPPVGLISFIRDISDNVSMLNDHAAGSEMRSTQIVAMACAMWDRLGDLMQRGKIRTRGY